jgi:hypothetical protein
MASAAAAPAAMPSVLAASSGIPASASAYRPSSRSRTTCGSGGTGAIPSPTRTWCAAVATAASIDALGEAAGSPARYGWCPPSMELTASYTAPCTIARWSVDTVGV